LANVALNEPISIRHMEVFVALIEEGSFTRAARAMELSQSTVSGHIADLERRLGVRLVERDRSGVRPTAAGHALLLPAREVLRAERNARMAVQELSGLLRGTLIVGGSTIPASYVLPEMFARFHKKHEKVALRLVTGDSAEVLALVRGAQVELGIVGARPDSEDVEAAEVGGDELTLVFATDHPFAARESVTVDEVLDEPVVMREAGSGTRGATEAALRGIAPDAPKRLNVACEVGTAQAQKAAVRAGLGVAFVSSLAVRDDLAARRLATTGVRGFKVARAFCLVNRPDELLSPAARAFRDLALS